MLIFILRYPQYTCVIQNNTKDILLALIAAVITPLIVFFINNRTNKRVAAVDQKVQLQNEKLDAVKTNVETVDKKVGVVETKLDESHKQMNGNLSKLIETTKELATEKEKAKHK